MSDGVLILIFFFFFFPLRNTDAPYLKIKRKSSKLAELSSHMSVLAAQHTGLKGSIEPLLEEADIDKDGKISLYEFRKLLRTASMSNLPSPTGVRNPHQL